MPTPSSGTFPVVTIGWEFHCGGGGGFSACLAKHMFMSCCWVHKQVFMPRLTPKDGARPQPAEKVRTPETEPQKVVVSRPTPPRS